MNMTNTDHLLNESGRVSRKTAKPDGDIARVQANESFSLRDDEYLDFDDLPTSRGTDRSSMMFDAPLHIVNHDPRLSYQWIRASTKGREDDQFSEIPEMMAHGWRTVSSGPLFNYFKDRAIPGQDFIQIEDMRLMVRRRELTEQAKREHETAAKLVKNDVERAGVVADIAHGQIRGLPITRWFGDRPATS